MNVLDPADRRLLLAELLRRKAQRAQPLPLSAAQHRLWLLDRPGAGRIDLQRTLGLPAARRARSRRLGARARHDRAAARRAARDHRDRGRRTGVPRRRSVRAGAAGRRHRFGRGARRTAGRSKRLPLRPRSGRADPGLAGAHRRRRARAVDQPAPYRSRRLVARYFQARTDPAVRSVSGRQRSATRLAGLHVCGLRGLASGAAERRRRSPPTTVLGRPTMRTAGAAGLRPARRGRALRPAAVSSPEP